MTDREKELEAHLENERREHHNKWRVLDMLALPDGLAATAVEQNRKASDGQKPFFSVGVRRKNVFPEGLEIRQALELLERFNVAGAIQLVSLWKEPSTSAVWWPDECNCSKNKSGAERVGEASVELTAHGAPGYHYRELEFWLRLPDGDREFVDVTLKVNQLPAAWEHRPDFRGISRSGFECDSVSIAAPTALQGVAYVRKNMGSVGSWRSESRWHSAEQFVSDLISAGLPPIGGGGPWS